MRNFSFRRSDGTSFLRGGDVFRGVMQVLYFLGYPDSSKWVLSKRSVIWVQEGRESLVLSPRQAISWEEENSVFVIENRPVLFRIADRNSVFVLQNDSMGGAVMRPVSGYGEHVGFLGEHWFLPYRTATYVLPPQSTVFVVE